MAVAAQPDRRADRQARGGRCRSDRLRHRVCRGRPALAAKPAAAIARSARTRGAGQGHRKAKSRRGRPARRGFRAGSGRRRRGARLRRQTAGTEDEVRLRHARRRSETVSLFLPRRDHAARPARRRGQGSRRDHLYSRRRPDRAQTAARLRRRTAGRGAIRPLARRRSLACREPRRHDRHQGDQCLGGEILFRHGDRRRRDRRSRHPDRSRRVGQAALCRLAERSPHRRLACPRRRGGR